MERSAEIELLSLPNKVGISMEKSQYEKIANFISTTLENREHKEIEINDLLDIAIQELDKEFQGNVSWYLLQVKNDMVVRGLINMVFPYQHKQMIVKGSSRSLKQQRRKQLMTQDLVSFS